MNIEKVARTVEQSVSGIRVKVLKRRYAELEELKVVFDKGQSFVRPHSKAKRLLNKHGFHNTHGYVDGEGTLVMTYARATSFGMEILEREAKRFCYDQTNQILDRLVKRGEATITLERDTCRMKGLSGFARRILRGALEMWNTHTEIEKVITPAFSCTELKALCRHLAFKAEELGVSADSLRGVDAITVLEILFDSAITKGREE